MSLRQDTATYRFDVFRSLGFNVEEATRLAVSRVDWHDVKRALDRGCTCDQAARIFL